MVLRLPEPVCPAGGTVSVRTLGVDVSAHWFDVARDAEVRRFPNNAEGITTCLTWLIELGGSVRVGMEATGAYHLPLATALHAARHTVLVCNPLRIPRSPEAVPARTRPAAAAARRMPRFCAAHDLVPWTPTPPAQQRLRALLTARETLVQEQLRLRNRQHAAGYTACAALVVELQAPVLAAIAAQIAHIDAELVALGRDESARGAQRRLLTSTPGLGMPTAALLLASLPLDRLNGPRQVAAYVGLCPRERSSGSSIRGRGRTGALGPAHLRKA